jgi:class 3 adenylate cyclase
MPTEVNKEIELDIAYVLFIDIVGYSKLVTHEQRRRLELLNRIVREAEHFRMAEANGRLITVPTGDGMALVFYNTPEAPVGCALEIARAGREHPELKLRMGDAQRTGQRRGGCKWSLEHSGCWNQHRSASDGLW